MIEEKPPQAVERYSTKLIKHAARGTWHFSKQQIIWSTVLGLLAAPVGVYFGLAPSILAAALAVVCVAAIAFLGAAAFNFLQAPILIYREQAEEIAALKRGMPAQQLSPQPAARSNIVCEVAGFAEVEIDDHDIVRRGFGHIAIVAECVNQPLPDRHIASEDYVMARITYFDKDGKRCQRVTHGTWLEEQWRFIDFDVGDTRHLVLAVQLTESDDFRPEMDTLRAIQNNHERTERFIAPDYLYLPATTTRAEVQIFSAENGAIVGQFAFGFDLTGSEPFVKIL